MRYFAPEAEVPFCGHATIATGVALAERDGAGTLVFHTKAGAVPGRHAGHDGGDHRHAHERRARTSRTSRTTCSTTRSTRSAGTSASSTPTLPPRIAYAGARHLILAAATRERLADLDYDFEALKQLMLDLDLITVDLVYREDETTFHARNPFPVGGVVEDPATGAAAAAFGNYLRDTSNVTAPATVTVHQGVDMGRPSLLTITIDSRAPRDPRQRPSGGDVSER